MDKRITAFTAFVFLCSAVSAQGGHGDPDDQYPDMPSWEERTVIVLTNACRMDPTGFRDMFVGDFNILLPQNYPPVAPLYWHVDLNRAARFHAEDMANNCGMQHNSCDGTSTRDRVRSYYTAYRGENISTGYNTPLATIQAWIRDNGTNRQPAPDNQEPDETYRSGDGHRKNMMNGSFREIGTGYAYGSVRYNHFWVQDFGIGTSSFAYHPVVSASHSRFESGTITYMANYYEESGGSPQSAKVVIGSQEHDLSLLLGQESAGTYALELPSADDCRSYHFLFTDSEGDSWRYPEEGRLVTYGEGGCSECYEPYSTTGVSEKTSAVRQKSFCLVSYEGAKVVFTFRNAEMPVRTEIIDLKGKTAAVYNHQIGRELENRVVINAAGVKPGMYYAVHRFEKRQSGKVLYSKFIVHR